MGNNVRTTMTLPSEELRTLMEAKRWLQALSVSKLGDINSREVREKACRLLHHWPFDYNLEQMYEERITGEL